MKKRSLIALILCAVMLMTTACGLAASPKTFSVSGLTIELTDAFAEKDIMGYTKVLQSLDTQVFILKEEFSLFAELGDVTFDDYIALVMEANGIESGLTQEDGLTYFTYEFDANGHTYTYFTTLHEGSDAFWLVQFVCDATNYEKLHSSFIQYAKSIKV